MQRVEENKLYHANVYLRISKEDGDKSESDSIANQRDLIAHFLADKPDIISLAERIDDGYSGVNFERPAFQAMLAAVKAGTVNCIIVKDLSRFGRNFVEVGRYIEQVFPVYGVRFIAVNDYFDSANIRSQSDNIILPFLNLINDAFCRDISIKVRTLLDIKRKKGEFVGSFAVYGYLKDPNDKHKLVVDNFAAGIVRDIFQWKIGGASQQRIADKLNGRGVLSPSEYKRFCGMPYRSGFQLKAKAKWTAVAVGRILRNECYIGTLLQGKRTTPNHKVKKVIEKPCTEWARVENNHLPVISGEDFAAVQRLLERDTRVAPGKESVYVFSGLIFCGDCRQNMVKNSVAKNGKTYKYYMCCMNRLQKKCSSHRISEQLVEDAVQASFNQYMAASLRREEVPEYVKAIPVKQEKVKNAEAQLVQKAAEIERYRHLEEVLTESLQSGIIEQDEYTEFNLLYDGQIREAQTAERMLKNELENILQSSSPNFLWRENFRQYRTMEKIDHQIAVHFIDKIFIYEDCRIEIYFRCRDDYGKALLLRRH